MPKHQDLQPWLDYFKLLNTYKEKGYLEVMIEKHEAYITLPALLTLAGCETATDIQDTPRTFRAVCDVVTRLRTYAAFFAQQGKTYQLKPFAVHMVKPDEPHDLLCTILVTVKRQRFHINWLMYDSFDLITY